MTQELFIYGMLVYAVYAQIVVVYSAYNNTTIKDREDRPIFVAVGTFIVCMFIFWIYMTGYFNPILDPTADRSAGWAISYLVAAAIVVAYDATKAGPKKWHVWVQRAYFYTCLIGGGFFEAL